MPVICRTFAKQILFATAFVLIALVSLFAFFDIMGRLGGHYKISQIFMLALFSVPTRIYEVMPIAVLLASVFVMSRWAARSEFTILRVSGLSPGRLVAYLMVPGLILVAFTYVFGEFVSPMSEVHYREYHLQVRSGTIRLDSNRTGTWVREVKTNATGKAVTYLNIRTIDDKGGANVWRVLEFDENNRLARVLHARKGRYVASQGWLLSNVEETLLPSVSGVVEPENVRMRKLPRMMFRSSVTPELFSVMLMRPERMSVRALLSYISHLKQSRQQYKSYEIGLWNKIFYPLAILVMMALSLPFAYLNARNGSMTVKIFAGLMIGLAFYTINNLFSYVGMLNTWPPLVVALLPSLIMLAVALGVMWSVERR